MRTRTLLLVVFLIAISTSAQVVITPSTPPVVTQGRTYTFTANTNVTWLCPGCAGTIDPTSGVYTAPSLVNAQQSYAGCQVLPNNHIFNTKIDSLPVNPNNPTWMAVAGSLNVNYSVGMPINVGTGFPTQNMSFYYTPLNNGIFELQAYPALQVESGTLSAPFSGVDRHVFVVDTGKCQFEDIYNPYPAGANVDCPTCTAQSGVIYSSSTYALPVNGASNAAGLYAVPLYLRLQELENAVTTGRTINHALLFTLAQGYCASSSIWPAQTYARDGGTVPFGARARLRASFDTSSFSPIAKVLLTQLKEYGIILSDGGIQWQIVGDNGDWPAAYQNALYEVQSALAATNMEFVDESSLMVSATSGLTTTSETVVASENADRTKTAKQQVVLTGVTIGVPASQKYIQAGAAAEQLVAYVNGSSNQSVTWTMTPSVGTLTSAGLYTPPAAEYEATTTTITATSRANASVFVTFPLTVFPNGAIYIVNGQTANYTDTHGNVWNAGGNCCGGDDGGFPYDNGGTWPSTPDITLYKIPSYSFGGDKRFDIDVPNGQYSITGKFASTNVGAAGQTVSLEAQGNVIYPNIDIYKQAGGANLPIDFTLPATVTNGRLSFVLRKITGEFNDISALQIVPLVINSTTSNQPSAPTGLRATVE